MSETIAVPRADIERLDEIVRANADVGNYWEIAVAAGDFVFKVLGPA